MSDCQLWEGAIGADGYGTLRHRGRMAKVRRVVWIEKYGPIPSHLHVHHKCQNKSCVNIAHLELLDQSIHTAVHKRGENNHNAVLNDELATYAMARLLVGEQQKSVAKFFGVSNQAINFLWKGRTWTHLFEQPF